MDIKSLLDTFAVVANGISTLAKTPGVNMIPYASTVAGAVDAIQLAVKVGANVTEQVTALHDIFSGGIPTEEKMTDLNRKIAELRARVGAPLPSAESGEPED